MAGQARLEPKTWIEISRRALESNFDALKKVSRPSNVMAIVKANAYGHGLSEVVSILNRKGATWFGVDSAEEALHVRSLAGQKNILVLGYVPAKNMAELVKNEIAFAVYDERGLSGAIRAGTESRPARIHLKVETGLYRQGAKMDELLRLAKRAKASSNVAIEGLSTHFANIEDTANSSYAKQQEAAFREALAELKKLGVKPRFCHTACSAAAILHPTTRLDLVRTGIALYGLWPSEGVEKRAKKMLRLKPVLTWKTIVAQVKDVSRGQQVGYGLTHRYKRAGKIAVLPIGYADGYDRVGQSGRGVVLVRGKRCPIVGRICMNMCMVDVTRVAHVKAGDEVVLLGQQGRECVTAEDLAERMGSINYEVVARLNPLIKKVVL